MITKQPQLYSCLISLSSMNLCHRYTDSFHVFRWLHVLDSWVLVNWVLTMSVTFIPNEEVVAVFCIFWSVSPYIYKKSMEIIVQKRDKTSAVSVIHVYLRSTDLIFLLAKSHFSYSRSMIWQKLFRIFSSMTVNSREKNYTTGKFLSVNGFWFYTQQQANLKIMEKTVWWSLCEKRHKRGNI